MVSHESQNNFQSCDIVSSKDANKLVFFGSNSLFTNPRSFPTYNSALDAVNNTLKLMTLNPRSRIGRGEAKDGENTSHQNT